MKPARFDYYRVEVVDEACALLEELGDEARILAGGQSLMPMLNMRLAAPAAVLDISRVEALDYVHADQSLVEVGAVFRQGALEAWPGTALRVPLLELALPFIGHYQTRSRGTVCGSIAHADPSAELPLVLVTLGGRVRLRSSRGERTAAADTFFQGSLETGCADDELITAVSFPSAPPDAGYAFDEVSMRHGDFAIVALAAIDAGDTVSIGIGGLTDRPVVKQWAGLRPGDVGEALWSWAAELDVMEDQHARAAYRRELVVRLGPRLAARAAQARARAAGTEGER